MSSEKLLKLLETSRGRDRFLRLTCYASKFSAGFASPKLSPQLNKLSKELSSCRAALRLLDSIPALANAAQYGLGKEDKDMTIRILSILSNIIDIVFCPVDNISWAITQGIITSNNTVWDTSNTALWVASLYINIMINLTKLSITLNRKGELMTSRNKESQELKVLSEKLSNLTISTVKLSLDLVLAVNYLPPGILWAGSLVNWQVGALGTLSSIIALYQSFK